MKKKIGPWTLLGLMLALVCSLRAYGAEQDVLYGIGSTSKVIVTAAVLQLEERGQLSLDAPLTEYIPEFIMADSRYTEITPRMLLAHTSGLPGSTLNNAMLLGDNDTYNHDNLLERLAGQRLKARPGEFAVYCNDGFTLAEILVERVSGKSFTDYVEQELAAPMGLTHIRTPQSGQKDGQFADVYDEASGQKLPPEMANVIGSGGIYATAEDLVRLSQIFMQEQGEAAGILSRESAAAMEISEYAGYINPQGRDSNLSYGLGWDSVDTYPFARYGVKALVKGGDTNYYHASLTVLPEENISCAVLTSGGGSAVNQLAVTEILMEYLEEIKRIERSEEQEQPGITDAGSGGKELSGQYVGRSIFTAEAADENTLILTTEENGREKSQTYRRLENGQYESAGGSYIGGSGTFAGSSNGRVGKTTLSMKTDTNGNDYLMAAIYETYPGLGTMASYLPMGQKIEKIPEGSSLAESWAPYGGQRYWLVSEKYSSALYLGKCYVKPVQMAAAPGYIAFENQTLTPAKITGAGQAVFFQQIPGQVGRDMSDYEIKEENEKTYFHSYSGRYLAEEDIGSLGGKDGEVIIKTEEEAQWFRCAQTDSPVSITMRGEGAWYAYDTTGREPKCVLSSYTTKGESVLLPADGLIVFAGRAGTAFTLDY